MKTSQMRSVPNIGKFLLIILILLVAAGCAKNSGPHHQSDFLRDYSILKPDAEVPGALFYRISNAQLKTYKRIMLDPITVHIAPEVNLKKDQLDPETIQNVTEYFYEAIKKAVEPEYPVVDKPDFDVARFRVAITAVRVNREKLKAYQYLPVALVITGAAEVAGARKHVAVLVTETEVTDSLNDRLLSAAVLPDVGKTYAKTTAKMRNKDIFPVLDYWAKRLRERLDAIHGK